MSVLDVSQFNDQKLARTRMLYSWVIAYEHSI
jgi:hypothetical protein